MMKLSPDQIKDLFAFVRKNYVEHYDLQIELVDHLANGIEQQWNEHPERSYKDARLQEFRKFGLSGFENVIRKRSWAMEKRYWKHIFRFYKEYFKLPKVLLLIGIIILTSIVIRAIPSGQELMAITGALLIVGAFMLAKSAKNGKRYHEKIGIQKRWMLEEKIFQFGNTLQLLMLPVYILNMFATQGDGINNFYLELGMAALIVCYLTISYVMVYVIPKKAEELLAETYPEYKIA